MLCSLLSQGFNKSSEFDGAAAITTAFTDKDLNYMVGQDIFLNSTTMVRDNNLAPVQSNCVIQETDPLEHFNKLPTILLHELCHSLLMCLEEEQMLDQEVVPNDISANIPDGQFNSSTLRQVQRRKTTHLSVLFSGC